jgi:periplasmic protein TonB
MDYAQQQRDPTKHAIGIGFVVIVHVIVIYALLNGLGSAIIAVVKKPLTATIIEELKLPPPPPPPPKKVVETKAPPPPQTFVPPPDIPVPTINTAPTITATTTAPPEQPHVIAPPAPPAPPPPKPAIRLGLKRLSGDMPEMPMAARRAGTGGVVIARLYIDEKGNVTEVTILRADPPRIFDRAVIAALKEWKFPADGEKYIADQEVVLKVE